MKRRTYFLILLQLHFWSVKSYIKIYKFITFSEEGADLNWGLKTLKAALVFWAPTDIQWGLSSYITLVQLNESSFMCF